MTTDDFTDAARAVGVDPEEVRESVRNATEYASFNGMSDAEFLLWIWHAGAIYGREYLAAQEPTDEARIEAASRSWAENGPTPASWYGMSRRAQDRTRERMRKALEDAGCLSAARAARRDEEKR